MRITVDTFSGMVPKRSARLLAKNQAQAAVGTRLESGDLESWSAPSTTQALARASATSIYLFAHQYWFEWTQDVDVCRGPVPGDTTERTYFTGTDQPRFTNNELALTGGGSAYPIASYTLGIPAPESSPAVEVGGDIDDDDPALVETRAYTYTYVSQFGEEGPPAPASAVIDWAPGQYVDVSGLSVPSGAFVIDTIRIYRTATSGSSTAYEFVDEVAVTASTYRDEIATGSLGEVLPSEDWVGPPDDMHSLVVLPNGIMAGASGLDICISEQYLPHAWPYEYQQTADDTVVGLGVVSNSIVVLTERRPYLITGSSPSSLAMTAIGSAEFACVSKRGIVTVAGLGVVFPTANGLCAITSSGATNLTGAYLSRDQWQTYSPETMIGLGHRGRYFGFHDGGCMVFDPTAGDGALYELDLTVKGGYVDPYTDTLYLIRNGEIQSWDAGSPVAYRWRSKVYELPRPGMFAAARVRAASYDDLTMKLWADEALVATINPSTDHTFRLPATRRGKRWFFELSGTDHVYDVAIAESQDEIA